MGCSAGFKYAKNALVAGASPGPHWASSRRSPRPLTHGQMEDFAPVPRWGQALNPRYRLVLCACHMGLYGPQSLLLDPPLLLVSWGGGNQS